MRFLGERVFSFGKCANDPSAFYIQFRCLEAVVCGRLRGTFFSMTLEVSGGVFGSSRTFAFSQTVIEAYVLRCLQHGDHCHSEASGKEDFFGFVSILKAVTVLTHIRNLFQVLAHTHEIAVEPLVKLYLKRLWCNAPDAMVWQLMSYELRRRK